MPKSNLEKYLYQIKKIAEHRDKDAEREIRKLYKILLKDLQQHLSEYYLKYAYDDRLDYSRLAQAGLDARFLEEVEQRMNGIIPSVSRQIIDLVEEVYTSCYSGLLHAVIESVDDDALKYSLQEIPAATPEIVRRAVQNPIAGLTLADTLEKHRKEIIYDIKRQIGVGLTNGDRYSTMARRISKSLNGDYKKSIRIVRTEAHRNMEAGHHDSASHIDERLRNGNSGLRMMKTWRTMKDERVRPNRRYKTKSGWKSGKPGKYNHIKMDGVSIPVDEKFTLPSGAKTLAPGQSGVAGEDINCRCYLSYKLQKPENIQEKSIENSAKDDTMKSGAVSGVRNPYGKAAEEHAKKYYGLVRSMKTDVQKIAKTTGYSEKEIQRIKNYIFIDKHDLGEGAYRRFDPDYMMGESWKRLIDGHPEPHDLTLLRHEMMEHDLIQQGYPQDKAHCITTKKYNYDKEASEFYGKIKKFKKE